jgi:light-harvesting complex 1 beta chain
VPTPTSPRRARGNGQEPFAEIEMQNLNERSPISSGLTEEVAREFHGYFMTILVTFVSIALVAHLLMWMWRPWFNVTVN